MTASRRVESSPGGVGFIRTDATKPNVPPGERRAWAAAREAVAADVRAVVSGGPIPERDRIALAEWYRGFDPRFYEGIWTTPQPPRAESTTEALYPSGCPGCGGAIRPGDVIGLVAGDWLCSACFQL